MTSALAAGQQVASSSPSIIEILSGASLMVWLVLILLAGFSIITWAIIFSKWKNLGRCLETSEKFLDIFWSGKSMDTIYSESKRFPNAPVAKVFQSGYVELQRLVEREKQASGAENRSISADSSVNNLERALMRAGRTESMKMERSMTFLATAGSTAPFIGLFGTVLGIMNSFQNIGAQGGASLGTVAPGIAEALFATAVGLAAAIPAVMGYNYYTHKIRALKIQMENFSSDFLNIARRNFLAS